MNSKKGFNYSILTFTLFLIVILLHIVEEVASCNFSSYYGFVLLGIIISTILGCVHSYKGRKEVYSTEKAIGLVLNGFYTQFFTYLIMSGFWEAYKLVK
ncbi:MAG: hypothetical protein ABI426_09165 [Flavobacterium sp.]